MSGSQVIFYIISAFILSAALLAVTTKKIFRAAIWLLFSLIGIAALYFWMDVQFIAAVQIIVYVGGIVVLIIFSIFLTQKSGEEMPKPPASRITAGAAAAIFGFAFAYSALYQYHFQLSGNSFTNNVNSIGTRLLNTGAGGFALPFEVVSILLLAAMIGCIVIAMKARPASQLGDILNPASNNDNQKEILVEAASTPGHKSQIPH